MSEQSDFYAKLKERLDTSSTYPSEYLFKFIVPTTKNQLNEVKEVFDISGVEIKTKSSKTKKYVSVSVRMNVKSSDEIISKYNAVATVEGIISL
jgi:putative lipoic acid-binding regulatory protein